MAYYDPTSDAQYEPDYGAFFDSESFDQPAADDFLKYESPLASSYGLLA